jgi:hypothetical protein
MAASRPGQTRPKRSASTLKLCSISVEIDIVGGGDREEGLVTEP